MCEIFALSAKRPIEPDAYLEEFFADSAWNPHGWGLVWYGDQGRELFKEPVQAVESGLLKYVLSWDLCSKLLIAHIRNATRGTLAYANCHPFEFADSCGRLWSICHNGTIIDETSTNGSTRRSPRRARSSPSRSASRCSGSWSRTSRRRTS